MNAMMIIMIMMVMAMLLLMMMRGTFLCNQALGPTMRPVGPCWLPWPEPLPERAIVKIGTTATIINIIVIIIIINIIIIIIITIIIIIISSSFSLWLAEQAMCWGKEGRRHTGSGRAGKRSP